MHPLNVDNNAAVYKMAQGLYEFLKNSKQHKRKNKICFEGQTEINDESVSLKNKSDWLTWRPIVTV